MLCVLATAGSADVVRAGALSSPTTIPRPVMEYADLLEQVNHSTSPAAIEPLYTLGMHAAESLLRANGAPASPLELMNDSTLAEVQRRMEGFTILHEEEFTIASCRPAFFLALAQSHGGGADIAFFRALTATRDSSDRPIYVQQQTDEAGCTRFGSGILITAYNVWNSFVSAHPDRYADWVRDEMDQLAEELTGSTCACEDRESVLRELRLFLRRFPGSALAPRVRARLQEVQAGTAGMRYQCVAG